MADSSDEVAARIAVLEAERDKLAAETRELTDRLNRPWYFRRGILETFIAVLVASGLTAGWFIVYLEPVMTAKIEVLTKQQQRLEEENKLSGARIAAQKVALDKAEAALKERQSDYDLKVAGLNQKVAELQSNLKGAGGSASALTAAERESAKQQLSELKTALPREAGSSTGRVTLRSQPQLISSQDVNRDIAGKGLNLPGQNIFGTIRHDYVLHEDRGVVIDRTTNLMWQQSGSDRTMTFGEAVAYVDELNRSSFGGETGWRLPTIEELVSLLEPAQRNGSLYIDPVFDTTQRWIISADKSSATRAWGVVFYEAKLYLPTFNFPYFVRAVRTMSGS